MNLGSGNPLHHRVRPADQPIRRNRNHRLLHGIQHHCQLVPAAFKLGEVLAEALGGLIQRRLHLRKLIFACPVNARGKVSVRDAAGKVHHFL